MTSSELVNLLSTEQCSHQSRGPKQSFCEGCIQEFVDEFAEDLLESVALEIEESEFSTDTMEAASIVRGYKK